ASRPPHRHVPSYPTRRSSDLIPDDPRRAVPEEPGNRPCLPGGSANRAADVLGEPATPTADPVLQPFGQLDGPTTRDRASRRVGRDRKSTRLNSSYVKNS